MIEVTANAVLFVSGLLLLIDIAPHDFFPLHKRRMRAFEALRKNKNLIRKLDNGIKINPGSEGMSVVEDNESYDVVSAFIRLRSPLAHGIDWSRAVGIGYTIQSLPVGKIGLEAFKPLYVALAPKDDATQLDLVPVGQLGDLHTWLAQQRQSAITRLAMALLVLGFLLQLIDSVYSKHAT